MSKARGAARFKALKAFNESIENKNPVKVAIEDVFIAGAKWYAETQTQAKWVLDDLEFGYDIKAVKGKIRNKSYIETIP